MRRWSVRELLHPSLGAPLRLRELLDASRELLEPPLGAALRIREAGQGLADVEVLPEQDLAQLAT